MTDNDIIKALEYCNQPVGSGACNKCPFDYQRQKRLAKDEQSCTNLMICNVLDLINRREAEIENQNAKIDNLIEWLDHRAETIRGLTDELKTAQAEIERLREAGEDAVSCYRRMEGFYNLKCMELKVAKTEAITEVAERLNDTKFKLGNDYMIYADNVSTVAKELKEGVNNA